MVSYIYDDSKEEYTFAYSNYKNGETIRKDQTLVVYLYRHRQLVNIPYFSGNVYDCVNQLKNLGFINIKTLEVIASNEVDDGNVVDILNEDGSVNGTSAYLDEKITITYYKYKACGENAVLNGENCTCVDGYTGDPNTGCSLTPSCGENAHYNGNACVCNDNYHDEGGVCVLNSE